MTTSPPATETRPEIRPLDDPLTVGDVLRATASSRPDTVAIVDERGSMTYAELDAAADHICAGLASLKRPRFSAALIRAAALG